MRRTSSGFTVIEFVVVAVVLAVILGLIIPGVQRAREQARQMQCQNNLKQIGLSCLNHEQAQDRFPTGGWGYAWTGDADLGPGQKQPGGWVYNIWPYIEASPCHGMGYGDPPGKKLAAHAKRLGAQTFIYYCPSRRLCETYPWTHSWSLVNADRATAVARTDYAANGGDVYTRCDVPFAPLWQSAPQGGGPADLAEGGVGGTTAQTDNAKATFDNVARAATGIIFCGSMVTMKDIGDGAACTYLVGEKLHSPDWYTTGDAPGDNMASLVGDCEDVSRWTFATPMQDTPGYLDARRFGSAHAGVFMMGFCDGSVRPVPYTIDAEVHRLLGNRGDGQAIDPAKMP